MGTYGILRFNFGMFPEATAYFGEFMMAIGVVNILYGAFCAMAQTDLKKLVAYSSVSHMGFVLIGMASFTTEGINGAVLQMFNHGTITAMLFLLVGVIYDRAHHRQIEGFGGLLNRTPVYSSITALAFFAALGLPGLSGFISEVLCFIGAFQRSKMFTAFAVTSVVITAAYMLWTYQRMFLGPLNEKYKDLDDMVIIDKNYWFFGREFFTLAPLAVIVLVLGVYPQPVLRLIEVSLVQLNQTVLPYL
jgi:NADH-quinone oxidoreductase subunit M